MLIDTSLTIAYKCPQCGSFEFFNVSLFALVLKKEQKLICRCNKSYMIIDEEDSRHYKLHTPCIGCGEEHIFILSMKELLYKDINVFYCPHTGMQQCFIGKDEAVRKKIDSLEQELDELIDMFGYDNYFKNTRVMLDSLNKVHDIAEQGNLYCECGNSDIEMVLLSDRIYLKCPKCSGNRVIYAATNADLKEILMKQQIILGKVASYDAGNGDLYEKNRR